MMSAAKTEGYASSDEEVFEDAPETVTSMELDTAMDDTMGCIHLFLNNKFDEARKRFEPWANQSMYHSLGYGTIMFIQACMTFEATDVEAAVNVVKRSLAICSKARKKYGFLSGTPNYSEMSGEQVHAELCYAESLLQRAILTFVQDENLLNFVKGGLKIRTCFQCYKECGKIMANRKWTNDKEKLHFESGVLYGLGQFNLAISLLPKKIMKLLEFVGFSGDKDKGMDDLVKGSQLSRGLRQPLAGLSLLAHHCVINFILGTGDADIPLMEKIMSDFLRQYPNGALFLFFAGRLEEIKGNISGAISRFEESIASQQEWKQFHHLCYWELMWCHSYQCDWLLAMKYAEKLAAESRWSRATYAYLKAVFLLSCDNQSFETVTHVDYLMKEVPKLKQRIAGKSLPIEKLSVKKAKKYFEQNRRLTLPAFEMIFVWNGFLMIGKNRELTERILAQLDAELTLMTRNQDSFTVDDVCLAKLIKGVCHKHLDEDSTAEDLFQHVVAHEKQIEEDHYLAPFAMYELATLHMKSHRFEQAKNCIHKAKHNYKGYNLESRLHFRLNAARSQMTPENSSEEASSNANEEFKQAQGEVAESGDL